MKKAIFKSIFKIQSLTRNVFLTVAADLQALLVVLQADVRAELLDIRPEPGEFSRKRDQLNTFTYPQRGGLNAKTSKS
jgi:hypothetical protein